MENPLKINQLTNLRQDFKTWHVPWNQYDNSWVPIPAEDYPLDHLDPCGFHIQVAQETGATYSKLTPTHGYLKLRMNLGNWWTMNSKFLPKDGRIPPKIKNLPCLHRLGEFQLNSSLVDANPQGEGETHETEYTKWKLWLMDRIRRTTGENTVNHGICFTAAGAGFCQRYVRLLECIQSFFSRVSLRNVWNTFLTSGKPRWLAGKGTMTVAVLPVEISQFFLLMGGLATLY